MQTRIMLLLFSGAIGITLSGCASSMPTMRGQSPGEYYGGMDGGHGGVDHECAMCDSGFVDAGMRMGGMVMDQQAGCCQSCSGQGCGQCLNLPFHPVHRNFHTYQVPRGLSYPEQNTPAATYQYPYYTFRGPTDFFMK
ncbi:MAG: hypothetical protein R3C59_18930 [Planctomycetaceae bacterium]